MDERWRKDDDPSAQDADGEASPGPSLRSGVSPREGEVMAAARLLALTHSGRPFSDTTPAGRGVRVIDGEARRLPSPEVALQERTIALPIGDLPFLVSPRELRFNPNRRPSAGEIAEWREQGAARLTNVTKGGRKLLEQPGTFLHDLAVGVGLMEQLEVGPLTWNPDWLRPAERVFGEAVPIEFQQSHREGPAEVELTVRGKGSVIEQVGDNVIAIGDTVLERRLRPWRFDPLVPRVVRNASEGSLDSSPLERAAEAVPVPLFQMGRGNHSQVPGFAAQAAEAFERFAGHAASQYPTSLRTAANLAALAFINRAIEKNQFRPWFNLFGAPTDPQAISHRYSLREAGVVEEPVWGPVYVDVALPPSDSEGKLQTTVTPVRDRRVLAVTAAGYEGGEYGFYTGGEAVFARPEETLYFPKGALGYLGPVAPGVLRFLGHLPQDEATLSMVGQTIGGTAFMRRIARDPDWRRAAVLSLLQGQTVDYNCGSAFQGGIIASYKGMIPIVQEIGRSGVYDGL